MDRQIAKAAAPGRDLPPCALGDDDNFAGDELALLTVDVEFGRAVDDEDENVAFIVHVLLRPCAGAPFEECCVQVIRRIAPHGTASPRRRRRPVESCGCNTLDQREELALLEPDVRIEPLAEFAHRRAHVAAGLECGDECVETLVIEQGLNEQGARLVDVDHQRKESFFLLAEVRHTRRPKKTDERRGGTAGIVVSVCGPAEPLCLDKGVMVVVRERDQRLKPLHPWKLAVLAEARLQSDLMLTVFAARAAAVLMVGIAAFQVALVFGAPWGAYTQGGGTEGSLDTFGRLVAAVSCVILLVMATAILARVREGPLKNAPARLVTSLAWFTTIYSGLAVVLNLATQSSSERAVFAPTAILLFVLVVGTMVGSRRTR